MESPRETTGPLPPAASNIRSAGHAASFGTIYNHQQQQHYHFHHREGGGGGGGGGRGGGCEAERFASCSPLMPVVHAPAATRPSPPHTLPIPANPNSSSSSYLPDPAVSAAPPHQMAVSQQSPEIGMTMGMGMGTGTPGSEVLKKKRGRPRKYLTDVNGSALALAPFPPSAGSPLEKKARSSGKKAQMNALGAAGHGFTPHVIKIAAGEDVLMKITSFLQHDSWGMCILSANGAISNVTLRLPATSAGTVTYEGRFDILSLSGSFPPAESGSSHSRTGGLSVSLAGPDGRVIGGGVAGLLMAASTVQMVVGTFLPESRKNQGRTGSGSVTHGIEPAEGTTGSSLFVYMPQSSTQDHSSRGAEVESAQNHHLLHAMAFQSMDWGGSHANTQSRGDIDTTPSPDYM